MKLIVLVSAMLALAAARTVVTRKPQNEAAPLVSVSLGHVAGNYQINCITVQILFTNQKLQIIPVCCVQHVRFQNGSGIRREIIILLYMYIAAFFRLHSWACLSPGRRRWWNNIYQVGKDNLSRYARG